MVAKPIVNLDGAYVSGGKIGIDNQGGNLSARGATVKGVDVGMKLSGSSVTDAAGVNVSGKTAVEINDVDTGLGSVESDKQSLSFYKKAGVFVGNAIVPVLEWIKVEWIKVK